MFNLKAANGQVIGTSEIYSSVTARDAGIESVKKNAPAASAEDNTGSGDCSTLAWRPVRAEKKTSRLLPAGRLEVIARNVSSVVYRRYLVCGLTGTSYGDSLWLAHHIPDQSRSGTGNRTNEKGRRSAPLSYQRRPCQPRCQPPP
jgi:uncharacterized protein YegP (UPF0339 family)